MKKILISTNMYKGSEFGQILPYLKRFPGQVGVEVFPMFHEECFEKNLRDAMPLLKEVPVSFHGPYYQAEHSAAEGTVEYARTMELLEKTLSYAKELSSKYLVYHHNNCRIIPGEKEDRVRVSCENYYTVKQLCEDEKVYGIDDYEAIERIRAKAIRANLKLIECPIRHLGTEEGYKIYTRLQEHLLASGVEIKFMTMVQDIIIEDGVAKGVVTDKEETYYADEIVSGIGREGSSWFEGICKNHGIKTQNGTVDVGVRVEVRDEIMKELNEKLYEAKLVYYTPTFDDKVRVFCTNPSGEVATEYYDNGLAVVNGHAYKSKDMKTKNTNFALLVSKNFTEPFKSPIEYGKHIAQLGNMLSDGKILLQRYGDFRRGRRTTAERLQRNNITPTLKDAVPGDLSLVFPHRIMVAIDEMIKALDKVTPGIASDETLLYGVEVKFYSNKVVVNDKFETNIKNLRVMGDGASITRGLQQASANGICVAREICKKMNV